MLVSDLLYELRADLDDWVSTIYSDKQLIVTINRALGIINEKLTEIGSHLVRCEYKVSSDKSELPDDFNRIISVTDGDDVDTEFRLMGNNIITSAGSKVTYSASFPKVEELDDNVNLPNVFAPMIVELSRLFVIKANISDIRMIANDEVRRSATGREISHYIREMPFVIK